MSWVIESPEVLGNICYIKLAGLSPESDNSSSLIVFEVLAMSDSSDLQDFIILTDGVNGSAISIDDILEDSVIPLIYHDDSMLLQYNATQAASFWINLKGENFLLYNIVTTHIVLSKS